MVARERPERLVAEFLQELRRPFDVRERERDRAGVQRAHSRQRYSTRAADELRFEAMRCPVCNQENPSGARFCLACGAPLAEAGAPQEERRIVSIIFVDLVGSTAQAEMLDPEDVRAILTPYHELVRREIESFGGVVEKFIGDAIMGVFGAPVAHGDDASAPCAPRSSSVTPSAQCPRRPADPGRGQHRRGSRLAQRARGARRIDGAGDVVNTASRLQRRRR